MSNDRILELEEGFWRASYAGDGDYYAAHLAADALLVFAAPTGVLDKARCVEIIGGSPAQDVRWRLEEARFLALAEDVVALTYRGVARPGDADEVDRRSSVYRREPDGWKLVLHHVTREG